MPDAEPLSKSVAVATPAFTPRGVQLVRVLVLAGALGYTLLYLACAILRLGYPWDLEWMEGGMLTHAARVLRGEPIYAKPSLDFVAFFYTPLYAWSVAALAKVCGGLSFGLGRAVSVTATLAIMGQLYYAAARERGRATGVLAVGLYACMFRTCGAFYDMARADSLSLALALGACIVAYYSAYSKQSDRGAVLSALLFVAAFFTKQTTAVVAPFVGLFLLFARPRQALVFGLTGIVVGLVCGATLDAATGGWFRFYAVQGHQGHSFSMRGFSFEFWRDVLFLCPYLWLLPALSASYGRRARWLLIPFLLLLGAAFEQRVTSLDFGTHFYYDELWYAQPRIGLIVPPLAIAVLLCAARLLDRSVATAPRFYFLLFAGSALSSALNYSTDWAYSNCFMPLAVFGSLCAAMSAAPLFRAATSRRAAISAACIGLALLVQFVALYYDPEKQVPHDDDLAAQSEVERVLAAYPGPVFMPAHPLYAYLRDGSVHIHQMGMQDVQFAGGVSDLAQRLQSGYYPTVVVDDRTNVPGLERDYVRVHRFHFQGPALVSKTGLPVRPDTVWLHRSVVRNGASRASPR